MVISHFEEMTPECDVAISALGTMGCMVRHHPTRLGGNPDWFAAGRAVV